MNKVKIKQLKEKLQVARLKNPCSYGLFISVMSVVISAILVIIISNLMHPEIPLSEIQQNMKPLIVGIFAVIFMASTVNMNNYRIKLKKYFVHEIEESHTNHNFMVNISELIDNNLAEKQKRRSKKKKKKNKKRTNKVR